MLILLCRGAFPEAAGAELYYNGESRRSAMEDVRSLTIPGIHPSRFRYTFPIRVSERIFFMALLRVRITSQRSVRRAVSLE